MKYILSMIVISLCAAAAYSQNSSLSGQVTDQNGAVISGTEVKAIAKDKAEFRSRSDSYGVYSMKLPGGTYQIEFKFPECKSFIIPEYVIGTGTNAMLDAELPAGNCEVRSAPRVVNGPGTGDPETPIVTYFVTAPLKPPPPPAKHKKRSKL